jgi:hypothetical protein
VVLSVCQEAADTKTLRGRHVNRILPITHSSFASLDEMKVLAPKLLADKFPSGRTQRFHGGGVCRARAIVKRPVKTVSNCQLPAGVDMSCA